MWLNGRPFLGPPPPPCSLDGILQLLVSTVQPSAGCSSFWCTPQVYCKYSSAGRIAGVLYWGTVNFSAGCYTFFSAHPRCIVLGYCLLQCRMLYFFWCPPQVYCLLQCRTQYYFLCPPQLYCIVCLLQCRMLYFLQCPSRRVEIVYSSTGCYTVCVFLKIFILTFRGEAKRSDTAYMLNIQYTIHTHFCGIAPCRDL